MASRSGNFHSRQDSERDRRKQRARQPLTWIFDILPHCSIWIGFCSAVAPCLFASSWSAWYFLCICIKRNVFLCYIPRFSCCHSLFVGRVVLVVWWCSFWVLLLLHVSLSGHYRTQLHFNERQRWAPVRTCADFFQSLSARAGALKPQPTASLFVFVLPAICLWSKVPMPLTPCPPSINRISRIVIMQLELERSWRLALVLSLN